MTRPPLFPILRLGAVVVFVVLLLTSFPPRPKAPERSVPGVWATDLDDGAPTPSTLGEPARPFPGQKKPPCAPRREREVAGACWIASEHKPPCPDGLYEGRGLCLVPVKAAERPPTTLGR